MFYLILNNLIANSFSIFLCTVPDSLTAEITFANITRNSFRAVFLDPPPQINDPIGRQILFSVLTLQEEGAEVEAVTINAVEGAYYNFLELKPGTNYSIDVNFLAGLPDGSQTELLLPDLPLQFVSTLPITGAYLSDLFLNPMLYLFSWTPGHVTTK